jgi:PAS domain S-box-containing protein
VALVALIGGVAPGVLTASLSALLGLAYLAEQPTFASDSQLLWTGLVLYVIVCAILIALTQQTAKATRLAIEAAAAQTTARENVLTAKLEAAQAAASQGQAERRLEQVTDALPVFISQVGRDLRFQFVNRAYEEWFGVRRDSLKGRHLEEIVGPEAFAQATQHLDTVFSGQAVSFETRVPHPSGEMHDLQVNYIPNLGPDGVAEGYFGFVQDVTEAKRQADLLAQRERHLRAVMESVTDCFYAVDTEWRITLFNRAAERYYGIGREAVLGRKLWEAFPAHVGSVFEQQLQRVMEERVPVTFEARSVVFLDRFIEMRVSPKDGGGIAVSFSDITCRKANERQRELLIHELNHRVKNSLAVIQSIAAKTFTDSSDPRASRQAFEGRLMALASAHDLLTAESWESAQLSSLIRATLRPFAIEDRLEVSGPDLRVRPQAAVSLALALHELATNATKYGALSNETGTIAVRWTVTKGELPLFRLVWKERGGPQVVVPEKSGFGSRLIQRGLAGELGGPVSLDFAPDGVVCTIEAPVANLQAQ